MPNSHVYNGFLSYSRAVDGKLAPALQRELQRFTKSWYRLRSLRIFRDNASLSANAGLWSSIEEALANSDWFILMASPEAARSTWVGREVNWWLENRSHANLLVVLTDGDIHWDDAAGDFDWSTTDALPPVLRDRLPEEPRWIDLRAVKDPGQVDRSNAALTDAVADVASAVLRTPKELLVGEHVRQHRLAKRLARGAVATLSVLLVVSVVASIVAVLQRNRAVDESRVATARQTAALAIANINNHIDMAQLLAVAAYRMDRNPQTLSALYQVATASPHLVRYRPIGDRALALAASRSGRYVVAGTPSGNILRWDVAGDTIDTAKVGNSPIVAVASNDDGNTVVAADKSAVTIWNVGRTTVTLPLSVYGAEDTHFAESRPIAVSPSGKVVAVVDTSRAAVRIIDGSTGSEVRTLGDGSHVSSVGLLSDSELVTGNGIGEWRRLSVDSPGVISSGGGQVTPGASYYCCAFTTDNGHFAWSKYGEVDVVPQGPIVDSQQLPGDRIAQVPIGQPDKFAINDTASRVALAAGGELYVAEVRNRQSAVQGERLIGTGHVDAVTFLGTSNKLVSASENSLILWDLDQLSRTVLGRVVDAPWTPNAGAPPQIAVAPRATAVAVAGLDGIVVVDLTDAASPPKSLQAPVTDPMPAWAADGSRLIAMGDDGDSNGAIELVQDGVGRRWPQPSTRDTRDVSRAVLAARRTPDGRQLISVNEHGDVQVRNAESGEVLRSLDSQQNDELAPPFSERQNLAAISTDGSVVATVLPRERNVEIVDVQTGRSHPLPGPAAQVVTFADDRLIVARTDNSVDVWDTSGYRRYATYPGNAGYEQAIAAIPGSRLLARLTNQGVVELSDIDSGQPLGTVSLPGSNSAGAPPWASTSLAGTPGGAELITATGSGWIVRWDLRPQSWIAASCRSASRTLTAEDWHRHLGATAPPDLSCG